MGAVWAVEVRIDDNDPQVFGPYTEAQAERAAARLKEEVELAADRYGVVHHPFGVLGAMAYPLGRYDSFLTAAQRRETRAAVRDANKETA